MQSREENSQIQQATVLWPCAQRPPLHPPPNKRSADPLCQQPSTQTQQRARAPVVGVCTRRERACSTTTHRAIPCCCLMRMRPMPMRLLRLSVGSPPGFWLTLTRIHNDTTYVRTYTFRTPSRRGGGSGSSTYHFLALKIGNYKHQPTKESEGLASTWCAPRKKIYACICTCSSMVLFEVETKFHNTVSYKRGPPTHTVCLWM
jgi:hypothetical protein